MAKNSQIFNIANDYNFQGRCFVAAISAAIDVMAEANNTQHHIERTGYARQLLGGSLPLLPIALAVLANPSIRANADASLVASADYNIPDSDIQFTVNSEFNALAGIAT